MLNRLFVILAAAVMALLDDAVAAPPGRTSGGASKTTLANRRVQVLRNHRSPKNKQRPVRRFTKYIILHTTEGSARGSLSKLSANGECHYVVDTDGKVYEIIDRRRVAYHAGLSMWNGQTGLDSVSLGIEVVGYHDKPINNAQFASLRLLVKELQSLYKIPDENVLTHSMVAYGNPNRWQKKRHRGRKRCGMLLASADARARLGLYKKPLYDPDIKAGRLVDADPELTKILYAKAPAKRPETTAEAKRADRNVIAPGRSAWDIARDLYKSRDTVYTFPDGSKKTGAEIKNWKSMPAGTRVEIGGSVENPAEGLMTIGVDGTVGELGGDEATASTTFYFPAGSGGKYMAGSSMKMSEVEKLPNGTRMLVGYKVGGPISASRPVFTICGIKWNRPDTFYLDRSGKITPGDAINERNIPKGAMVFFR